MKDDVTVVDPADVISKTNKDKPTKDMTDWKKEPTLDQLKSDYDASKTFHEAHMAKVVDWVNCFDATGKYAPPDIAGRSKIAPKLVRKQVEWRCPSLTEPFLSNKQLLQVSPRTYEDVRAAKQNQLVLNYQFQNKLNLVKLMDEIVRTMATEGTAILKPIWVHQENTIRTYEDIYEPQLDPTVVAEFQQLMQNLQQDDTFFVTLKEEDKLGLQQYMQTGQPLRYIKTERRETEELRVTANHPDVEICDIDDVYVDPTCKGKIEKAKFIVRRFTTCIADLEADGRYKNLKEVKAHVASNTQQGAPRAIETGFQFKDDARKQIEAYEYWGYWDTDDSDTLNPIVATWVGNILIQLERSPYSTNRLPFIFIPLVPVKGSLYGEPDAELLSDNQAILGATMRGLIDLMGRSANGQIGTAKGFLDNTNKIKFNNGENYDYNGELPPDKAIYTHKFPELPASAFNIISLVQNEAESLSGVKAFNTGMTGDALGKVAAGVRSAMDASAKRDAAILRRIAEGITELAYIFQELNGMFLTEDDVIRLTNDTFIPIDQDNMSGDFDLKIDISTAEEDAAKVNDLSFLLQTGQNSFPFEYTKQILAAIASLKKLPDLARFIEDYTPAPDPIAEQKAQLELQKLQLENELIRAQIAEVSTKANVNSAEVGVREQRAGKLQSDTDAAALKYYKSAEGIDQQEALEKIQVQADAQRRKADLDHLNRMDQLRLSHNASLLKTRADAETNAIYNTGQNTNNLS